MCRADVEPAARQALAGVLTGMVDALIAGTGLTREQVTIGPVDFGGSHPDDERQR